MNHEKTYICSKEQFLKLKAKQIEIANSGRTRKQDQRNYVNSRRQFYHSKGMLVPSNAYVYKNYEMVNVDKQAGFSYEKKQDYPLFDDPEPRYFNVIYGIVKGRSYYDIENKVRDGNQLDMYKTEKYCKKYGVDYKQVQEFIWLTTSSK